MVYLILMVFDWMFFNFMFSWLLEGVEYYIIIMELKNVLFKIGEININRVIYL